MGFLRRFFHRLMIQRQINSAWEEIKFFHRAEFNCEESVKAEAILYRLKQIRLLEEELK